MNSIFLILISDLNNIPTSIPLYQIKANQNIMTFKQNKKNKIMNCCIKRCRHSDLLMIHRSQASIALQRTKGREIERESIGPGLAANRQRSNAAGLDVAVLEKR